MRVTSLSFALMVAAMAGSAAPARAWLDPYVRIGAGGNQVAMQDVNAVIATSVGSAEAAGVPVSPKSVGPGYGVTASAGMWLAPGFRVGATFSQQTSRVDHGHTQTGFKYENNFEFQMQEIGIEAAFRIPALAGFTLGGNVAHARGEVATAFVLENVHGDYYENTAWTRDGKTYAVFAGLDQTAANGIAGFLLVGYHWRDMGSMDATWSIDDNGSVSNGTFETIPVDYSGWSVKLGAGFDLNW